MKRVERHAFFVEKMNMEEKTMEYDYRTNSERMNQIATKLDSLSVKQLKILDEQLSQQETDFFNFNSIVLSVLQELADLTNSLLIFEENEENQLIIATLKNRHGFDITQSCKYVRGLLAIANYIGISLENNEIVLSLNFDYEK